MTKIAKGYGKDLRMMRLDCKITQGELAVELGVTKAAISKIETGAQQPSIEIFQKWAIVCGFTAEFFFHRTNK